jgi:large repetitive protein
MPNLRGLGHVTAALVGALLLLPAAGAEGAHVECGEVITQDTTLDADLLNCPGDGIVIGADGVILDLNGHTIDGDGDPRGSSACDTGVVNGRADDCSESAGHDRVTVRNGVIRQFAYGVQVFVADATQLLRLTVSESSGVGVSLLRLSNALIEGNQVLDGHGTLTIGIVLDEATGPNTIRRNVAARNQYGIYVTGRGQRILVEDNFSFGNHDGLRASGVSNFIFRRNRVFANAEGMDISDGVTDNVIERNRVWDNHGTGLWMGEGAHRNIVKDNVVLANAVDIPASSAGLVAGILLWEGHDNVFTHNRVIGNGGRAGLALTDNTRDNVVEANEVAHNTGDGILLSGLLEGVHLVVGNRAARNGGDGIGVRDDPFYPDEFLGHVDVQNNHADRNGDDGIDVELPTTTLTGNWAKGNLDLGIEAVAGVIDGGRNRAFANGNPAQCVGVTCTTRGKPPR